MLSSAFENNKDIICTFSKFIIIQFFPVVCLILYLKNLIKKTTDLVNNVCKQEAYSIVVRTVSDCVHGLRTLLFYYPSLSFVTETCIATFYPDKPENNYCLIFNDTYLLLIEPNVEFARQGPQRLEFLKNMLNLFCSKLTFLKHN